MKTVTGIFVVLLSQGGSESNSPGKGPKDSLRKVTSEAAVRRFSSKEVFLNISQY